MLWWNWRSSQSQASASGMFSLETGRGELMDFCGGWWSCKLAGGVAKNKAKYLLNSPQRWIFACFCFFVLDPWLTGDVQNPLFYTAGGLGGSSCFFHLALWQLCIEELLPIITGKTIVFLFLSHYIPSSNWSPKYCLWDHSILAAFFRVGRSYEIWVWCVHL